MAYEPFRPARAALAALGGLFLSTLLAHVPSAQATIGMTAPEVAGQIWLNGQARPMAEFRGKVVLIEFWTFGCYNCRNVEPYVKAWHRRYAGQGLIVIGVHSPEFKYEHDVDRVKRYLGEHAIEYLVAIDNDFSTWNRYGNRYWPAMYLIDKEGVIRYVRAGEGGYDETERVIRRLLAEAP
jgi:thiol-disulfide isomerase/thioredoxin